MEVQKQNKKSSLYSLPVVVEPRLPRKLLPFFPLSRARMNRSSVELATLRDHNVAS